MTVVCFKPILDMLIILCIVTVTATIIKPSGLT